MIGLFTSIETINWQVSDFQNAAQFCKTNGIDTLIVKCYEVTQGIWYGNNLQNIVSTIQSAGINFIPYGYHYGDASVSNVEKEMTVALGFLKTYGSYCADMESDWDGHTDWAQRALTVLQGHAGSFYVSTWANVSDHNWLGIISTLTPVTASWWPQPYSDNLYNLMMQQWPSVSIQPTFSVVGDGDPTNPVNQIQQFKGENISIWEYKSASSNIQTLVQMVNAERTIHPVPNIESTQIANTWNASASILMAAYQATAQPNTGIYNSWLQAFLQGHNFGPPITLEFDNVDLQGNKLRQQNFMSGIRCEWRLDESIGRWYDYNNSLHSHQKGILGGV